MRRNIFTSTKTLRTNGYTYWPCRCWFLPDSAICNDTKYPCQNIWLIWRTISRRSMASIIFCIYSRNRRCRTRRARSFTFVTHRREIFLPPRCGSCVGGYRARWWVSRVCILGRRLCLKWLNTDGLEVGSCKWWSGTAWLKKGDRL